MLPLLEYFATVMGKAIKTSLHHKQMKRYHRKGGLSGESEVGNLKMRFISGLEKKNQFIFMEN